MTLEQILQACKKFKIHEKRVISDEYYELVIFNDEIEEWSVVLSGILGDAQKPRGVEPTQGDLDLTKASGGIRVGQTLFKKELGDLTIIAKFWPWDDDAHTTLKMALLSS
jgi:hypothetical protein